MRVLVSFLIVVILGGCTYLTKPREQPIIEDRMGDKAGTFGTLAVDSTRRIVTMNLKEQTVCAEPPPDVAETVARSFAAAIQASAKTSGVDARADASLASQYQTAISQLAPITQGVKYARDNLFALCQARSNDYIDNESFFNLFSEITVRSSLLVSEEIPLLLQYKDDSQAVVESASSSLPGRDDPQPSATISKPE